MRAAYERFLAASGTQATLESRVLPKHEEALRQVSAGYRSGRFSSLELLDAQRSILDTEIALIESRAEARRARAALERLLGTSLDTIRLREEGR
jgi:cobalt-zinc-cadmium efflux system outer membrane protein